MIWRLWLWFKRCEDFESDRDFDVHACFWRGPTLRKLWLRRVFIVHDGVITQVPTDTFEIFIAAPSWMEAMALLREETRT